MQTGSTQTKTQAKSYIVIEQLYMFWGGDDRDHLHQQSTPEVTYMYIISIYKLNGVFEMNPSQLVDSSFLLSIQQQGTTTEARR